MTYIYALVDPRDGRTRYVGKSNDPRKRLQAHLANNRYKDMQKWLVLLRDFGLAPSVVILAKVRRDEWQEMERFQIAFFRGRGMADLNVADGGEGHTEYECSQATRRKISLANKGKKKPPFSEEHRRHISESHKGLKIHTEEHKANLSKRMAGNTYTLGRPISEEHRQKLIEANTGRKCSEETRRAISKANKGKKCSEETKRAVSEANKGKRYALGHKYICNEETRRKLSETGKRRTPARQEALRKLHEARANRPPVSDETRRRMSESGKNRLPIGDETRRKMSEVSRGRKQPPRSEEWREKQSKAHKGKPLGAEHRRKLSEANKGNKKCWPHYKEREAINES